MRNDSRLLPLLRRAVLPLFVLGAAACADDSPLQPGAGDGGNRPAPGRRALGVMEITISGIGTSTMSASALPVSPGAPLASGASFSLTPVEQSGKKGIQLEPYSIGSFTHGERGNGGVRYLYATFRVRNASTDSTPYTTPRTNLTFVAASTPATINGTAISELNRFDGTPAAQAIAPQVIPTGAVAQTTGAEFISFGPDVLQVFEESDLTGIPVQAGVELFPYGFVVRHATSAPTRTLAPDPAPDEFEGVVTFAFKIPLQTTPAEDPFMVSAVFQAVDDSKTRITQSLEEQTPASKAAFLARAQALGASMKTVLPGPGSYWGEASSTRTVCTVRTAGPGAAPTGYLVQVPVASVSIASVGPFATWPLWAGGNVARKLDYGAWDGSGTRLPDVPVHLSPGTPGVLELGSNGLWYMVPRLDPKSSTVAASACGHTAATVGPRTSAYSPLAAGRYHSLALRTDGTVAAWGNNDNGQTTVPAGLTDVVQVAAGTGFTLALRTNGSVMAWGDNSYRQIMGTGFFRDMVQVAAGGVHALALMDDGTVFAWGGNSNGQTDVPAGLANVVQVAAGGDHSLALKADGTVVPWGDKNPGQTSVPAGLTDVVQVAAGEQHSLALKADGTVVAWGDNSSAQTSVPAGLADVVQVAAGGFHSLALKADGTVVAWGHYGYGQTIVPYLLVAAVP
jgi:hypothetical protein